MLAALDRIQDKDEAQPFVIRGTSSISAVTPSAYVVNDTFVFLPGAAQLSLHGRRGATIVAADHQTLIEAQQADPMCQTIKELVEGRPVPDYGFKAHVVEGLKAQIRGFSIGWRGCCVFLQLLPEERKDMMQAQGGASGSHGARCVD